VSRFKDCLDVFGAIGTDRYLSPDEVPAPANAEGFLKQAWQVYEHFYDGFTGSRLDPLFHGLDATIRFFGRPVLSGSDAVLVVGTGPSLAPALDELARLRERVHIFTSLRGAEALRRAGVTPDLVLIEHGSALDAELSTRQPAAAVSGRIPWFAIDGRMPARLLSGLEPQRVFVPDPFPTWGSWPATAVTLALQAGAGKVGLLGIDLGTPQGLDPDHRPLAELLSLLAVMSSDVFLDCGTKGASKTGWRRVALEEFAACVRPSSLNVLTREHSSVIERRDAARELLASLEPWIAEAREGLACALEVRRARRPGSHNERLRQWTNKMLAWRSAPALRIQLQEGLSLSFLPRLWRTGIDMASEDRLWRPGVLALHEMVAQAESLERKVGKYTRRKSVTKSPGLSAGPEVLVIPLTYACNVRCEMCTIWRREEPESVSLETLRNLLDDAVVRNSLEVVNLTGGEPFLRKDLLALLSELVTACPRLREVGIPTNGSMPSRIVDQARQILEVLPNSVTLTMIVSLDGSRATHDRVRGVSGLHTKVLQTLRGLTELAKTRSNMTVGINMTVMPNNVSDISEVESVARQAGVGLTLTPAVDSDIYIDSGSVRRSWSGDDEAWRAVATKLRQHAHRSNAANLDDACGILEGEDRKSPCVFWNRGAFVDADGGLYVCPVSGRGRFGSQHEGGLGAAWGSDAHRAALARLRARECRSCVSNCMASEADRDDVLQLLQNVERPIIIFGAGAGGRKVYQRLDAIGVPIKAFVDNRVTQEESHPFGVPLLPWNEGQHCREAFTVVASATGSREIARQLEQAGLQNGKDYVCYF
jgi:MoaA/NifB/PqqE/SkfB family radical SAM enzyme